METARMNRIERFAQGLVRRSRLWLVGFTVLTVFLGWSAATGLRADAAFSKMIPLDHPFMKVFTEHEATFGGANRILVAVAPRSGDVYNEESLNLLRKVTEEVFFIQGVERSSVTSLFTPNVRFTEVVEEGFRGGNIVSADFQGRPEQIDQVRSNVAKSDWVGRIVARDGSAALVAASLQERDPQSGERLNLQVVARALEDIRNRHESETHSVHIIGFAKATGDIADGAAGVLVYFGVAFLLTCVLLLLYNRSVALTLYALGCAIVPVIWLLGLMPLLGLGLDPLSILVPFLIFSIAVSHAVQMTEAWRTQRLAGLDAPAASVSAFCQLLIPGAVALLANALGFIVIALVDIEIVRELAITATLGVTVMILSNKLLLPAFLALRAGVPPARREQVLLEALWKRLARLVQLPVAVGVIGVSIVALAVGGWVAKDLQIGDLGQGVPELRPDSRYNQDTAFITDRFEIGVDVLRVLAIAQGSDSPCVRPEVMDRVAEFELQMRQNPSVVSVSGLAGFVGQVSQAYAEGHVKWNAVPQDSAQIAQGVGAATRLGNALMNPGCGVMPVSLYTTGHQASTISALVDDVQRFAQEATDSGVRFELGLGNLAVMAATNEVVAAADPWVNAALFSSVAVLCLLAFRSWRITLCIILPLALVTVLCNAVMTLLNIGVKVNTLPVVALGVGVGVDYGIYLFERIRHALDEGHDLQQSLLTALRERGAASTFTAVTMTLSVLTWMGSSLQFQSDMGILLAFMFLVNLLGAILLAPALAAFLVHKRT
jgi:predicted RND superfamily exporter protein